MESKPHAPQEQIQYANLLFYGCWIGILLMLLTYIIYLTGLLGPYVSLERTTVYWSMPVGHYVHDAGIPVGWGWLGLLEKGDFLNFIGIVLLASMTLVCFLTLIPVYIRRRDWAFAIIAIMEVLVLCLAASGILGTGGH